MTPFCWLQVLAIVIGISFAGSLSGDLDLNVNEAYAQTKTQTAPLSLVGSYIGVSEHDLAAIRMSTRSSSQQQRNQATSISMTGQSYVYGGSSRFARSSNGRFNNQTGVRAKNNASSVDGSMARNTTADAYACQSSSVAWSIPTSSNPLSTSWFKSVWTAIAGKADVYTTSEGIPVAHGTLTSTGVTKFTSSSATTILATFSEAPAPDCWIPMDVCTIMYHSYMNSLGLTLFADPVPTGIWPIPTNSPRCGEPLLQLDQHGDGTTTSGDPCSFWGGNVELFYWPPETNTAGMHPTSTANATVESTLATEVITSIGNITMTSPSVYLSLDMLTAWTEGVKWVFHNYSAQDIPIERQIGSTYKNVVIAMDPTDVSTLRYVATDYSKYVYSVTALGIQDDDLLSKDGTGHAVTATRAVEFAHLTAPSPEEYFLNPNYYCFTTSDPSCGTIFNGDYRPQLSLPSKLLNLDPAWASCLPYIGGVYDP